MRGSDELLGVLTDLALGGVNVEVGTTPFDWSRKVVAAAPVTPAAPAPVQNTADDFEIRPAPRKDKAERVAYSPTPENLPPLPRREAPKVRAAVSADVHSAPGGVVVACAILPSPAEWTLLTNMLKAVGLAELPRAIVVGNDAVADAVLGQQPTHVLVLGQAPLSALLGKTLGVEEWQRAPQPLLTDFAGPVGVTYPLELLLKNALYKKRTWQHLLKWIA